MVVAPMDTVVGEKMINAIEELGSLCIPPRDISHRTIFTVSTKDYPKPEEYKYMPLDIICIDVANGYHTNVEKEVKSIRKYLPDIKIITGNVASLAGYIWLSDIGVDAVRVGIGGGSVCTTSVATGIGVGQASIVRECAMYRHHHGGAAIIADGGIKSPGDVVKAIALGADVVMVGGAFAGAKETPGRVLKIGDRKYKHLAGQASMYIKGQNKYVEGADVVVPYTGPIAETWHAFKEGIQSGMAYLNKDKLEDLRLLDDIYFTLLSDAAKTERKVHAI
jgi:IMP dehydrogenase/GMP reductase